MLDCKGQKIKDCSNCTVPHHAENYKKILNKLQKKDIIVDVDIWKMKEEILDRVAVIASWDKMDEEMHIQHRCVAQNAVEKAISGDTTLRHVQIILQKFSKECIQHGYFEFGEEKINCNLLEKIDLSGISCGYIYAFHSPEIEKDSVASLLEQYYLETFQIACMDVIREWIKKYLVRKYSVEQPYYCSPSFGPGYYGMSVEAVAKLMKLIDERQIGICFSDGKMYPMMSLVGMYLVSEENFPSSYKDCEFCVGQKGGCAFCQSNIASKI